MAVCGNKVIIDLESKGVSTLLMVVLALHFLSFLGFPFMKFIACFVLIVVLVPKRLLK
jgi:hypothetical protein